MVAKIIDLRSGKKPKREPPRRAEPPRKEKRPTPLRVRRRRFRLAVIILVLIVLGLAAYALHRASYLPRFTIAEIQVSGTRATDPSVIEHYVNAQLDDGKNHFFARRNIFFYPKSALEKGIVASFPRVASARLSRSGLSTMVMAAIVERQPYAKWCDQGGLCYDLDGSGFIFAEDASTGPTSEPYIFGGGISEAPIGHVYIPGHMPGVIALLRILQQQTGLTPTGMTVENDEDIAVHFAQGFSLKASFGEDAAALARNLALVLSSSALQGQQGNLEYIDLRFGDRVYYKLKGQDQAQQ